MTGEDSAFDAFCGENNLSVDAEYAFWDYLVRVRERDPDMMTAGDVEAEWRRYQQQQNAG